MKKLIFIGILIFSWIVFTAIYLYSGTNLTTISSNLNDNVLTKKTFNELLKGEKIAGRFTVPQNYLGQLSVRFYNYDRKINDQVIFRIKEKNAQKWYYEHTYETNQFLPDNLFPFGFPVISDSKGKTYFFEVESVKGTPDDSVTLSRKEPLVALSFKYPKLLIVRDKKVFLEFVSNKISYTKVDHDFIISFLTYVNVISLFEFLEYLLLDNLFKSEKISIRKLSSSHIIVIALILLLISAIILYLKKTGLSYDISTFGYFTLVIGVIYATVELKRSK
jgi:hypothetical protein